MDFCQLDKTVDSSCAIKVLDDMVLPNGRLTGRADHLWMNQKADSPAAFQRRPPGLRLAFWRARDRLSEPM